MPRREGPVYAFLRDGWNGALDGARKAIGEALARADAAEAQLVVATKVRHGVGLQNRL